jgi:hypothetical protein
MCFHESLNVGFLVLDKNTDKLDALVFKLSINLFYSRSLLPALWSPRRHELQNRHLSLQLGGLKLPAA